MPNNMSATIRRLTMTFIVLLLAISAVAAYIQVSNQAFIDGPTLAQGAYDPRTCPPYDAPLRGTIYDRNGTPLAWMAQDPNARCGWRRVYNPAVYTSGLAPLLGYFSYNRGVAGIEASYNDQLAGIGAGASLDDLQRKLLHEPRYGKDLYLTIDLRLQQKAGDYYDSSAFIAHGSGSVCQPPGSKPGSLIVEDPNTGEILALVSKPSYDPNKVDDDTTWAQINNQAGSPLIDHATLPTVPGSTFKTLTLIAALDNGADMLEQKYTNDPDPSSASNSATHFDPDGKDFEWVDYTKNGEWQNVQFPISMQDGYAYSDNTIFARVAVDLGANKWLGYAEKFGIKVPGANVTPVPFDAPVYQNSSIYPAQINGKPTNFDTNLLAASGFGQGDLLISPLTMAEIDSAVATGGTLYDPHVVRSVATHDATNQGTVQTPPKQETVVPAADPSRIQQYQTSGQIFARPDTAPKVRQAMWAVTSYGTGVLTRGGTALADQQIKVGGKTGTGEAGDGSVLTTWWISLAPDDQAPNAGGPPQLLSVLEKDKAGEGACQVYVAYDTYEAARQYGYLKV